MNLASALFKRLLEEKDLDTWSSLRRHYLPSEYHEIYDTIEKQVSTYNRLPTVDELSIGCRDTLTQEKILAFKTLEVDAEPFLLLDYLKNEFTQTETLKKLQNYVENTIAFESAEETIESLYKLITEVEDRVELQPPEETMQGMNLFESEDDIAEYIPLGLNAEFDKLVRFKSSDYILMGGARGSGKSITCSNLANTVYARDKSVLYFSIEMPAREVLQRQCSIATGVAHSKIKYRTLDNLEWELVARWWANRYSGGEEHFKAYKTHRDFDRFHRELQKEPLGDVQLDIIYDPSLTLPKLRAEIIKRTRKLGNVGLIIVDYVNQIKRYAGADDKFDWKDQISVSTALKEIAGQLQIPIFSPYQIDASGEARFAKGILDSADAAFTLKPGDKSIEFTCTKMRGDAKINFTSAVDWGCLKVGPDNGEAIETAPPPKKASFKVSDTPIMDGIYDDPPF